MGHDEYQKITNFTPYLCEKMLLNYVTGENTLENKLSSDIKIEYDVVAFL
jgi:hypothetical protein